jgi:hypothetical protein
MVVADREEVPQLRVSNGLGGITRPNAPIDLKRLSPTMANRPPPDLDTKNPGRLAGRTGVDQGSAGEHEQEKFYSIPVMLS